MAFMGSDLLDGSLEHICTVYIEISQEGRGFYSQELLQKGPKARNKKLSLRNMLII
jgi:hypothetical protein